MRERDEDTKKGVRIPITMLVFIATIVMTVVGFIVPILFVGAIIGFVAMLFLAIKNENSLTLIVAIVGIIALILILVMSMVNVPAGYKVVITSAPDGKDSTAPVHIGSVLNEGWNFNPYYILCGKEMIQYNNRAIVFTGQDEASDDTGSIMLSSSDGVSVYVDFTVTYNIPENQVSAIRLGYSNYEHSVIIPECRSKPRDAGSQFTAFEMYSAKRGEVESKMNALITASLAEKGVQVTNFALRDVRPPQTFVDAIEAQKVAQQQMQTASFVAQSKIISAQGNLTATLINANASAQAIVIQATADMQSALLKANGSAGAVAMIADMMKEKYPNSNESAYLEYMFIQAIQNPDCAIKIWMMPSDGSTPVLLNPNAV
jgi:regulator of protease activity HflC (stomatin/prohibitin superfamily)